MKKSYATVAMLCASTSVPAMAQMAVPGETLSLNAPAMPSDQNRTGLRQLANADTGRSSGTTVASTPAPAAPPAAAPSEGGLLSDIVVTARRTQEKQQTVPVAVTAFDSKALEQRHIVDIRALSNVAPGLSIVEANAPTTLIVLIRGLGNTNPNTGSDAAVGLYLNDVPINIQNGTNIGLFDTASVQVLKGPQGTLFGRNTTGGALLLNERKPTDRFEGYVQAGGTFFAAGQGFQGEGVVNIPITSTLAFRAGISVVERDGYVRNIASRNPLPTAFGYYPTPYGKTDYKNLLPQHSQAWRASLRWTPSADFESVLFYDGGYDRSTGLPNASILNPNGAIVAFAPLLGYPDPTAEYARLNDYRKTYFWATDTLAETPLFLHTTTVSDTSTLRLSDTMTLKNIIGYRRVRETYAQDIVGLGASYFDYRQLTGGYNLSDELQIQGRSVDNRLTWVGGIFYFRENRFNKSDRFNLFGGPGGAGAPDVNYHSYSQSYSAFGQATFHVTDALSLTGGLRYTIDKRRATLSRPYTDVTGAFVGCGFPGFTVANCELDGKKTFRALTYTVSADYKIDPKTLVYIASRRGYRSGGFSSTQSNGANGLTPFQPERLTDYEIGAKRDWKLGSGAALRTNLAIYRQNYSQIQRLAVDPNNVTSQIIVNVPSARVTGGEFEATLVPVKGISLTYGYARVVPKYKDFIANGVDQSSNTFSFAPRNTHTVSGSVQLPLDESVGKVTLTADYHYQSKFFYEDQIQTTRGGVYPVASLGQKGYSTVGMNLTWAKVAGSHFDLEAFVTNLTNAKVLPSGTPATYASLGVAFEGYGVPPRMAGFNLRYNFGS